MSEANCAMGVLRVFRCIAASPNTPYSPDRKIFAISFSFAPSASVALLVAHSRAPRMDFLTIQVQYGFATVQYGWRLLHPTPYQMNGEVGRNERSELRHW